MTAPAPPWTPSEDAELLHLCTRHLSYVEISARIGRSAHACKQRKYNLSQATREPPPPVVIYRRCQCGCRTVFPITSLSEMTAPACKAAMGAWA